VIVAGIAILLEVVDCFGLDQIEASERDILWGLARSITDRPRSQG
jgi:exopolyphosphatase/pppGpp-phosphohydrolase